MSIAFLLSRKNIFRVAPTSRTVIKSHEICKRFHSMILLRVPPRPHKNAVCWKPEMFKGIRKVAFTFEYLFSLKYRCRIMIYLTTWVSWKDEHKLMILMRKTICTKHFDHVVKIIKKNMENFLASFVYLNRFSSL